MLKNISLNFFCVELISLAVKLNFKASRRLYTKTKLSAEKKCRFATCFTSKAFTGIQTIFYCLAHEVSVDYESKQTSLMNAR